MLLLEPSNIENIGYPIYKSFRLFSIGCYGDYDNPFNICKKHDKGVFKTKIVLNLPFFYPTGKPMILNLICFQRLAVAYYSLTLDALDLPVGAGSYERHPRLLQHLG
jgi:hypothetical protein